MDEELNLLWMKDFELATRPTGAESDEWRLLVADNFGSHISLDVIDYAVDHNIEMVGYIPHSTHLLQGLDITCFGTFKTLYGKAREKYEHETGLHLTKEEFLKLFAEPFNKAFSPTAIKAAFRVTGVEPINPTIITPAMVAPAAERSATVAFPLQLPQPVAAVLPYFRALQQRTGDRSNPATPLRLASPFPTEPATPVPSHSSVEPKLTPHKTRADIQQMSPTTRHHTLEARRNLQGTSAAFLTRPLEEINSHCHLPQPQIVDAPTLSRESQTILREPVPITMQALQAQNNRLRGALREAEGHIQASGRIIEAQNVTMALQAVGYEEQVRKLGAKEQKMRSNRQKLLLKKTGRHLTGNEFRAAAAQDTATRDANKARREAAKSNREVRAALKQAHKNWRAEEVAGRRARRVADIAKWERACEECRAKGIRCPKKPRAPKRAATPVDLKTVSAAENPPQNIDEGDGDEDEDDDAMDDD